MHSKPAPINDVAEFPCDKCGKCCENVHLSNQTRWLNRGDGVCRYFDTQQRNCSIYASRPDICRVKTQFDLHYKQQMSWDAFVAINLSVCEQLKRGEIIPVTTKTTPESTKKPNKRSNIQHN